MAFLKGTHFAFEDAVKEDEKKVEQPIVIPFVVTHENNEYHGFVPGILMQDIICSTKEECIEKLKPFVKKYVIDTKNKQLDFPFFPTNEQIKQDFKNVVLIKRVSVKL